MKRKGMAGGDGVRMNEGGKEVEEMVVMVVVERGGDDGGVGSL